METVKRVPGESLGLTVDMHNFGSGDSVSSGLSIGTKILSVDLVK